VVHLEHLADGARGEGYLIHLEFLKALKALLLIIHIGHSRDCLPRLQRRC